MTARGTCDVPPSSLLDESTVAATTWTPFVIASIPWGTCKVQPNTDLSPPARQIWPRRGS